MSLPQRALDIFYYNIFQEIMQPKKDGYIAPPRKGKNISCRIFHFNCCGYISQMSEKILTFISKYAKISYNIIGGEIWKIL